MIARVERLLRAIQMLIRRGDRDRQDLLELTLSIKRLDHHFMTFREDFDASETRLEGLIGEVVTLLQNLPDATEELTQADVDRVKAAGDALAAAFPSSPDVPDPSGPIEPTPVEPTA